MIAIRPFTAEWTGAVQAFNGRLLAGGLDPQLAFPEDPRLEFPRADDVPVWQEAFLAVEDDAVRGAYYFTHERYRVGDRERWIAHYRHPISEVVVNKAYKGLGSRLLADALTRQELLYGIGMGSERNPNLRRFLAEGWEACRIPFFVRFNHPRRVLRTAPALRKSAAHRLVLDLAAASGLGWLGVTSIQALLAATGGWPARGTSVQVVPEFGDWADPIWRAASPAFSYAAVRDAAALNVRYSPRNPRFVRLRLDRDGRPAGWAVLLVKQMESSPYFGDLLVGAVVDCLALPGREGAVARAASNHLARLGVDLTVTNQSFRTWRAAFRGAGFAPAPSNYFLTLSPALGQLLRPLRERLGECHVNRGDGAGISRL